MVTISPDLIKTLITESGYLFVPDLITKAIGECLASDPDSIEKERQLLIDEYKAYWKKLEPIRMNYDSATTLDAYTVHYLPRNTLIPKIAFSLLSNNPAFVDIPNRINILDLGSGSGGVILGLLDLFSNQELADIKLDIVAVDSSSLSLDRQNQLINHTGYKSASYELLQVDLSEPNEYEKQIISNAPYDYIFSANLITELDENAIEALLKQIKGTMTENGVAVIAEAPRDYVISQIIRINKLAKNLDLYVYYPCPIDLECPKSIEEGCWVWRRDDFNCQDIRKDKTSFETMTNLVASWMIICSKPYSVYDKLMEDYPQLKWGAVAPAWKEKDSEGVTWQRHEVCTQAGKSEIKQRKKSPISIRPSGLIELRKELVERGSIMGFSDDFSELYVLNLPASLSKIE